MRENTYKQFLEVTLSAWGSNYVGVTSTSGADTMNCTGCEKQSYNPFNKGLVRKRWLSPPSHSGREDGLAIQLKNRIRQDRDFEAWSQKGHRHLNRGNNSLRQTYAQRGNKLHGFPDISVMVGGGLAVQL